VFISASRINGKGDSDIGRGLPDVFRYICVVLVYPCDFGSYPCENRIFAHCRRCRVESVFGLNISILLNVRFKAITLSVRWTTNEISIGIT
jgi:hypothetical protein